ncbi:MAG: spore germination protein, partial [Eubacterium sp.]|nr:spore germination protein [Eubacterium sp.]
ELSEVTTFEDAHFYLASGFAIVFVDGVSKCLSLGIQGFSKRQTDEPPTEADIKGARNALRKR